MTYQYTPHTTTLHKTHISYNTKHIQTKSHTTHSTYRHHIQHVAHTNNITYITSAYNITLQRSNLSDIVILTIARCVAFLHTYIQFSRLRRLGCRYLFGGFSVLSVRTSI